MLKLHIKTTYPVGTEFLQRIPAYNVLLETLQELTAHLLQSQPEFSEDQNIHLRVDSVDTLEHIRELTILRNQWALDNPRLFEYRVDNNITRDLKIVDDTTNSVVLDWTQIPNLEQSAFVTWVNETIV